MIEIAAYIIQTQLKGYQMIELTELPELAGIVAVYEGVVDEKRNARIVKALEPYWKTKQSGGAIEVDDGTTLIPVCHSNVDWNTEEFDDPKANKTIIEVWLEDKEQADRCASALRGCGMWVSKKS